MRLEKRFFEKFLEGVKKYLPSYYNGIIETVIIDTAGYKMGFDKEPAYIFDFELSEEKLNELKEKANTLRRLATANNILDEELFAEYDDLVGFISSYLLVL